MIRRHLKKPTVRLRTFFLLIAEIISLIIDTNKYTNNTKHVSGKNPSQKKASQGCINPRVKINIGNNNM
jgi:hypothetical protein